MPGPLVLGEYGAHTKEPYLQLWIRVVTRTWVDTMLKSSYTPQSQQVTVESDALTRQHIENQRFSWKIVAHQLRSGWLPGLAHCWNRTLPHGIVTRIWMKLGKLPHVAPAILLAQYFARTGCKFQPSQKNGLSENSNLICSASAQEHNIHILGSQSFAS